MIRNWRNAIPNAYLILITAVLYLLTYIFDYFAAKTGSPPAEETAAIRFFLLSVFALFHGWLRLYCFHPLTNTKYKEFLCVSPWSIDKGLPGGSFLLNLSDFLVLGFVMLLTFTNFPHLILTPAICFFCTYLLLFWLIFWLHRQKAAVILIPLLAPFTLFPYRHPALVLFVLIVLYVICVWESYRYFKKFPWNTEYWESDPIKAIRYKTIIQRVIGWPQLIINAYRYQKSFTIPSAFLTSFIISWWFFALLWTSDLIAMKAILFEISWLAAFMRLSAYINPYRPPISLFGRFSAGRIIIPRYDIIFVAPVCILLIGLLAPYFLCWFGIDEIWCLEITIFLIFFIAFAMPPKLQKFNLTGHHRIAKLPKALQKQRPPRPLNMFEKFIVSLGQRL
jgi:hypothetical protein